MALSFFTIRKSIFGRMLGISSTGGLVMGVNSTGKLTSTDIRIAAQMWGPGMVQTMGSASSLTLVTNCGITYFTSDSSADLIASISGPALGVSKKIVAQSSATGIIIETTATTIVFQGSSVDFSSTKGSTQLVVTNCATNVLTYCELVGLSTTQWLVMSRGPSAAAIST